MYTGFISKNKNTPTYVAIAGILLMLVASWLDYTSGPPPPVRLSQYRCSKPSRRAACLPTSTRSTLTGSKAWWIRLSTTWRRRARKRRPRRRARRRCPQLLNPISRPPSHADSTHPLRCTSPPPWARGPTTPKVRMRKARTGKSTGMPSKRACTTSTTLNPTLRRRARCRHCRHCRRCPSATPLRRRRPSQRAGIPRRWSPRTWQRRRRQRHL